VSFKLLDFAGVELHVSHGEPSSEVGIVVVPVVGSERSALVLVLGRDQGRLVIVGTSAEATLAGERQGDGRWGEPGGNGSDAGDSLTGDGLGALVRNGGWVGISLGSGGRVGRALDGISGSGTVIVVALVRFLVGLGLLWGSLGRLSRHSDRVGSQDSPSSSSSSSGRGRKHDYAVITVIVCSSPVFEVESMEKGVDLACSEISKSRRFVRGGTRGKGLVEDVVGNVVGVDGCILLGQLTMDITVDAHPGIDRRRPRPARLRETEKFAYHGIIFNEYVFLSQQMLSGALLSGGIRSRLKHACDDLGVSVVPTGNESRQEREFRDKWYWVGHGVLDS
jgi:hypothetical protein